MEVQCNVLPLGPNKERIGSARVLCFHHWHPLFHFQIIFQNLSHCKAVGESGTKSTPMTKFRVISNRFSSGANLLYTELLIEFNCFENLRPCFFLFNFSWIHGPSVAKKASVSISEVSHVMGLWTSWNLWPGIWSMQYSPTSISVGGNVVFCWDWDLNPRPFRPES